MQKATIHQSHVYRRIKISQTLFEKGHPRNNPVKLFQILISSFWGEKFWRISLSPYCAKCLPPPLQPCFSTDQNFINNFWKGSPKEQSCEIISLKSTQCKNSPFSPLAPTAAMFFDGSKFRETIFKKGHTRNNLVKLFKILTSSFREVF